MSTCKINYCILDLIPIRELYKKHKSFFDSIELISIGDPSMGKLPRAYNMVKSVFDEN